MTGVVSHISSRAVQIIIGVDTHKDQHVAVALDGRGVRLDEKHVPVATCGYEELERWSCNLGQVYAFGVEGTGSYGAGLARFLTDRGYTVVEVNRPDRSVRYRKGKSDPTDAEMAARAVLAGVADATPKSGKGEVEMIRMLKSAKDSAVKARTQAVNQMKALVVTAPAELRETLDGLTTSALVKRCRSFRPGRLNNPTAAAMRQYALVVRLPVPGYLRRTAEGMSSNCQHRRSSGLEPGMCRRWSVLKVPGLKYALRSLACRYRQLSKEIQDLKAELERLTQATAPALVKAFGIGPDTAAALLVAAGSNPDRLNSEAAFAALCGVNPIPASSGKTNRHRLNRGGDRQANAALYRIVVVRLRYDLRTQAYLRRRTAEGMSKIEVIRCLKRYVAREVYSIIRKPAQILDTAA